VGVVEGEGYDELEQQNISEECRGKKRQKLSDLVEAFLKPYVPVLSAVSSYLSRISCRFAARLSQTAHEINHLEN
jgi:hypothetical protein